MTSPATQNSSRARLQWLGKDRSLHVYVLPADVPIVRIGRHPSCEVILDDPNVSRRHVLLTRVDDTWFAEDVSSSGTDLEREQRRPLRRRQALSHGDTLHLAFFALRFKDEAQETLDVTVPVGGGSRIDLTPMEQKVLQCMCRPVVGGVAPPASNREIAEEMVLTVDGVRSHIRSLYSKFGIVAGTSGQRRITLVQRALDQNFVVPE